jgi:hypothetical protein
MHNGKTFLSKLSKVKKGDKNFLLLNPEVHRFSNKLTRI